MLNYICDKDELIFRVNQMDPQVGLLGVVIRCPICRENINVSSELAFDNRDARNGYTLRGLPALELFQASNGMGFNTEQDASFGRVSLSVGATIKDISMQDIGKRVIVESITIEDAYGARVLHFGVSTKGATIYKVVPHV